MTPRLEHARQRCASRRYICTQKLTGDASKLPGLPDARVHRYHPCISCISFIHVAAAVGNQEWGTVSAIIVGGYVAVIVDLGEKTAVQLCGRPSATLEDLAWHELVGAEGGGTFPMS